MSFRPDAYLKMAGFKANGIADIQPGPGFNARILGTRTGAGVGAIGSLWIDTDATGAINADYSQLRLTRAGVAKWRFGNNLAGDGNDKLTCYSDVAGAAAWTVNPSTLVHDFAVSPTVAGVAIGSGGEANTASNLGAAGSVGIFAAKTSVNLGFKSLIAGAGVTLVAGANDITISSSGGGGGSSVQAVFGSLTAAAPRGAYTVTQFIARGSPNADMPVVIATANFAGINLFSDMGGGGQTPGGPHYGWVGMGSDNGLHMSTNLQYFSSGTSPILFDPTLPRGNVGFDAAGTFSLTWDPAAVAGSGYDFRLPVGTGASGTQINASGANVDRSNAPYPPLVAQSFVIMAQGYNSTVNATADGYNNVWLATMRNGQAMVLATTTGGPNATPVAALQVTPGGNINIFRLAVIGGIAGIPNIRLQSIGTIGAGIIAAGTSYIWYDGTNLKASAGTTTVNIV